MCKCSLVGTLPENAPNISPNLRDLWKLVNLFEAKAEVGKLQFLLIRDVKLILHQVPQTLKSVRPVKTQFCECKQV